MKNIALLCIIFIPCFFGCGEAFLDMKPNQTQRIPESISDFQAMMEHTSLLNTFSSHALGIIGADESNMPDTRYNSLAAGVNNNFQKRAYTWDQLVYEGGETNTDWSRGYSRILQCNTALDGLRKISPKNTEQIAYNIAKGSALFYRAMSYYTLAQLFCKPYTEGSANSDPGLPLRLEADVTVRTPRASVAETYDQILEDLLKSLLLLPDLPKVFFQPSKAAAYGLLSKVYLQTGDYVQVIAYANESLKLKREFLDLNNIDLTARYVFSASGAENPEVIFMSNISSITPVSTTNMNISQELLETYTDNDLRKKAYFFNNSDGRVVFKGSYWGSSILFTGLATDEIILNRAEALARTGKVQEALADLNALAITRYDKNTFHPFMGSTAEVVLQQIVNERRKELVMRGIRWEDLRRYNKEPNFAKVLSRKVNDKEYYLEPNSVRYVWPIPPEAIDAGGYLQNNR